MLTYRHSKTSMIALPTLLLGMLIPSSGWAEHTWSFYGGRSNTRDSDLHLSLPGETELNFHQVSWDDKSFKGPFYYGYRYTYWREKRPNWGIALDFTHPKMIAELDQTVRVTGVRNGKPVDGPEKIGDTFSQSLELSHGHNLLTINVLHRWFPTGKRDATPLGRMQPYVGAGLGVAIPHVEATVDGVKTFKFQVVLPAYQGILGVNYDLDHHFSAFTEYKFSYADLDTDLSGGGTLATNAWTHHFVLGFSLNY